MCTEHLYNIFKWSKAWKLQYEQKLKLFLIWPESQTLQMIADNIDASRALAHVSSMQPLIYEHFWHKMTDYGEEQRNELEAIESIYPDSFTGLFDCKWYRFMSID